MIVIEIALIIAFVLSVIIRTLIIIRRNEKRTENDYKNSEAYNKTREEFIRKINEKRNKKDE